MGFHPTEVWQFWQAMFRLPCGLRESDRCRSPWPKLGAAIPISSAQTTATAKRNFAIEPQSPKGVATSSQREMHFWGHVPAAFYTYFG